MIRVLWFVVLLAAVLYLGMWGAEYIRALFQKDPKKLRTEDLDLSDAEQAGEWLHRHLMESSGAEDEPWARERVERVSARLQVGRRKEQRLKVEILWVPDVNACTFLGRYIYVSRRLLERTPDDEPIAFVIAHEIAHHELGHVDLFRGWMSELPRTWGGVALATLLHGFEKQIYGPERELEADRHALELCIAAGYDPRRCLKLFDILEAHALDRRDVEGVHGPESIAMAQLEGQAQWRIDAQKWLWKRLRGYPSIDDRRSTLRELLPATPAPPHA